VIKHTQGWWNALGVVAVSSLALTACGDRERVNTAQQIGANPVLPKAQDFLVPPMQVPDGVGWKGDAAPKVVAGLKIEKIASGLLHPRQLLVLPNQDVLVVEGNGPGEEPVTTPKQVIAGIVKNRSGKGGKGGNRVTLLRKKPGAAGEWEQHVFIDKLHSPFGIQLVGDTLYVANTGNIMKYKYTRARPECPTRGPNSGTCPVPSTTIGRRRCWPVRTARSFM
jgi:glucose/arabinose dehydrogenase